MAKSLRIQDKNQIEEIVILLHNVAYKTFIETSKYETRKINTRVHIGSCILKENDYTKLVYIDIADNSMPVYIKDGDTKTSLNVNNTDILYISDDIVSKIDEIKAEIIQENEKMYNNGKEVITLLKSIIKGDSV